jgi:ADP-heptose:LPS heptosyltransferase
LHPTRWHYVGSPNESILKSLSKQIQVTGPFDMSGPVFDLPDIKRPYIVVRPVCHRKEWTSDSRSPLPEYVAEAIEHLRKRFTIVSVADLAREHEWALDPLPYADLRAHAGELHVEQLLGLIRGASGLVGGVGWIVPAALAYKVPLFLIYGGWGFSNGPHRLFGPDLDSSFIDQVMPNAFCFCNSNRHICNKRIDGFDDRARAFALRLVRESALAA